MLVVEMIERVKINICAGQRLDKLEADGHVLSFFSSDIIS